MQKKSQSPTVFLRTASNHAEQLAHDHAASTRSTIEQLPSRIKLEPIYDEFRDGWSLFYRIFLLFCVNCVKSSCELFDYKPNWNQDLEDLEASSQVVSEYFR